MQGLPLVPLKQRVHHLKQLILLKKPYFKGNPKEVNPVLPEQRFCRMMFEMEGRRRVERFERPDDFGVSCDARRCEGRPFDLICLLGPESGIAGAHCDACHLWLHGGLFFLAKLQAVWVYFFRKWHGYLIVQLKLCCWGCEN